MLTQLKLLAEAHVAGDRRLQVLEVLRDAVLETQHARSREYWGKPVPFDNDTREIFERSIALWRTLADAYESLIADMAEALPELAEYAEVICYRALRCAGFAMAAHNRAYYAVPGTLWQQLHRLYAFAESAEVLDTPVSEGAGRSTVNLAYLQIVLAQCASPDSLSLLQMNAVDRALAQWVTLGALTKTPVLANPGGTLAVDLNSAQGAQRLENLPGDNLRYLDLEKIGDKLRHAAVALKTQSPDKLGFGMIPRELCEKLMLSLHAYWLTPGTARVDERKPVSFNVLVSDTLAGDPLQHQRQTVFGTRCRTVVARALRNGRIRACRRSDGRRGLCTEPHAGNMGGGQPERFRRTRDVPQADRHHLPDVQRAARPGGTQRQHLPGLCATPQCRR